MSTFSPPVVEGVAWGDHTSNDPGERLMSFYGGVPTGETVWKDAAGEWHQGQYPDAGNSVSTVHDWDGTDVSTPTPGLLNAQKVFQGGHIYEIDAETEAELIDEGYGDYITP